ncbi:MAG: RIP metalloprotease RseP [Deltaproteobacteria bacterium RBG_13_52_11]|nr:MAG: RIP metalloprotease RseP [Deltaproteobacteria bacterium RBG_13_52_11]
MIYILAFLWVLGILIFIHEFGHFLVAKLVGVKVLKFSLGFGPKLISRKIGDTEYMISAFPLGGYVKPLGDNPREEVAKKERGRAFIHQPVHKRMAIVVAGPLANFLLAVVIFFLVFCIGVPQMTPVVGEVVKGFPAQEAGVKSGDVILKVDDAKITQWVDLPAVISKSEGRSLQLTIKRGGKVITVRVIPRAATVKNIFGDEVKTYQIGISASGEFVVKREPVYKAIGMGFSQSWFVTKLTVLSIVKIIQRAIPAQKALGGPILIAQMAGKQAQEGFLNLIFFTAVLSVNLCILNLFPIPILDGGHLLFMTIESIIGRPLSVRKMEVAQQIGLIILILLMVFVFYNDIMRVLPQGTK